MFSVDIWKQRKCAKRWKMSLCTFLNLISDLWKQEDIHHDKMTDTSPHNKQMENFVTAKVFMFIIEDRNF